MYATNSSGVLNHAGEKVQLKRALPAVRTRYGTPNPAVPQRSTRTRCDHIHLAARVLAEEDTVWNRIISLIVFVPCESAGDLHEERKIRSVGHRTMSALELRA